MKETISVRTTVSRTINNKLKIRAMEQGVTKDDLIQQILAEAVGESQLSAPELVQSTQEAPVQPASNPTQRIQLMGERVS